MTGIESYILSHIDAESPYLHELWRDTQLSTAYGQMASGHLQGRLLKMLVSMIRPRKVLEIGTFSGYSALCMAEALEDGAELHTIEIFDEMEDFICKWFRGSAYADKLHLHIGDARLLIPQMDVQWDLVFMDADKRQYVDYYQLLVPRMRKDGYIIADNTLWYGHVLEDETRPSDAQTLGIKSFNEMVAKDDRVEKIIIPVRDGLTIIRIKNSN